MVVARLAWICPDIPPWPEPLDCSERCCAEWIRDPLRYGLQGHPDPMDDLRDMLEADTGFGEEDDDHNQTTRARRPGP